jgi:hypothetical protein
MNKHTTKFTVVCKWCGREFQAPVFWARYCCDSHRQLDYMKRKQEQERKEKQSDK